MNPVSYLRADSSAAAIDLGAASGHRLLGGGTNLIDLMRKGVEQPAVLVDVSALPAPISETAEGGLLIGAAARNSAVAAHPLVRARYPMLTRAILAGASAQIRNMATVGGNLMQRTRCMYFADPAASRCNKRVPGSGCDAQGGFTRYHAILGGSPACIATHPSDMAVALVALGARVHLASGDGERSMALTDFHQLPGATPEVETILAPGEMIVAVELPQLPPIRATYRKVRDRASYAFALVSVAAGIVLEEDRIADVRIAFGGIAAKPWRAWRAEAVLRGGPATAEAFARAAQAELADAEPLAGNGFKVPLAERTLIAVLAELTGVAA